MTPLSDLARDAMKGDKGSFEKLVMETRTLVFRIVYSHVQDKDIAEDLSQDTYLKAYGSLNGLKDPLKIKSWLCSIASHTAIDWIRRKKEMSFENVPEESIKQVKGRAEYKENEVIDHILEKLEPPQRKILFLRYVENLSYNEIAEILNMTASAVGVELFRLRNHLETTFQPLKGELL